MEIVKVIINRLFRRWGTFDSLLTERNNIKRIKILERFIPKHGVGAEVGVFKGDFSLSLYKGLAPEKLFLFDPWFNLEPYWTWAVGDRSTVSALIRVLKRLRKPIDQGKIQIYIGDDLNTLTWLQDNSLDWVYIDSSHEYEHTLRELELLCDKVKVRGIISGDDWREDSTHMHHGVYRAVSDFIRRGRLELTFVCPETLQWVALNKK